ncbi:MAG TPA: indole-3-glycerol phosphate synthase TrpC [Thermodesulfobacteriota bacterium]|nr:indole-3-glycerol phosphate synthase TrpC [Thermodesulfobacteriota bacterium]
MHAMLKAILAEKEKEIDELKSRANPFPERPGSLLRRDFKEAISRPGRVNLIAEIKFASPSAGRIREGMEPEEVGKIYEQAGAAAISLLTDKMFFAGDIRFLSRIKKVLQIPVLRKDFIVDPIQVRESAAFGADALLLIARILTPSRLKELIDLSRELEMSALVEVHNLEDLDKAIGAGAEIIGINNRDLDTFAVTLETSRTLLPRIPQGCVKVAESGIKGPEDINLLAEKGLQAVLVGTSLMKAPAIKAKAEELVQAGIKTGDKA